MGKKRASLSSRELGAMLARRDKLVNSMNAECQLRLKSEPFKLEK